MKNRGVINTLFVILITIALVLTFGGCGKKQQEPANQDPQTTGEVITGEEAMDVAFADLSADIVNTKDIKV